MNPTFSEIDFYDYKIRMCTIDGTKMYLVSDLLRQYNEKNGTNKRFKKYLENKQAQEVIEYMAKSVGENSPLRSEEGQNTVGRNSDLPSKEGQNEQNIGPRNSEVQAKESQNEQSTEIGTILVGPNSALLKIGTISAEDGKWNISHVIQYMTLPLSGGANKGYIVCEELLHACLEWADPVFACAIYRFLTQLRERDNEFLKRQIDELIQQCKELKNRYVPDDDHWTYYLTYKIENKTVYLYSQFCRMERWDIAYKEIEKNGRHELYRLNRLPNGCIFRSMAEKPLKEICEKYDGKAESVCHFSLPLKNWVDKDKRIMASIRLQLKQVRIDLGWRTDLNNLNNE